MPGHIPGELAFEKAAVLPLGLATAETALFQRDLLARLPPLPQGRAKHLRPAAATEQVSVLGGSILSGRRDIRRSHASSAGQQLGRAPRHSA
jgi:hypothetical protein